MIALVLAVQLATQFAAPAPPAQSAELFPPPARSSEVIQALRRKSNCAGDPGRIEASAAQPTALYRKGDRPAKGLKNWIDYPSAALCLAETGR